MTILNTYTEASSLLALYIILGIAFFISWILLWDVEAKIGCLLCVVGVVWCVLSCIFTVPVYQYHEVIADNINSIDQQRYQIIKQRGMIYVVKDLQIQNLAKWT